MKDKAWPFGEPDEQDILEELRSIKTEEIFDKILKEMHDGREPIK